jgi:hypothetical protein
MPVESDDREHAEEAIECHEETDPLDENIYGLVLASLLRDGQDHVQNTGAGAEITGMGSMRILTSLAVYLIMLGIQVFLIYSTKTLITPPQVKSIRRLYSDYEQHMYTDADGVEHTYKSSNGFLRGRNGFFNPDQFDSFDSKSQICMLPMSQPKFIFCILWIWLVTVLKEFRDAGNKIIRLIAASLRENVEVVDKKEPDHVIVQFVQPVNVFICVVVVLLPKIVLCCYMAWLGSRWLVSTVGFSDVLLNAVALAFIFDLATLIYDAAVPYHTKEMVTSTRLPHLLSKDRWNFGNDFGTLLILVVAAVLAACYMFAPLSWGPFAQHVLPDYKWDVCGVCGEYLLALMNTDADPEADADL